MMQNRTKRLGFQTLESRRLLAVVATDDSYEVNQNQPLHVGYQKPEFKSLVHQDTIDAGGNVVQLEHSPEHQLLFMRNSGSQVRVWDLRTKQVISSRLADFSFTDMSLTPDGRYLFAADYAGERTGYGTPLHPHLVHRFDSLTRTWTQAVAPRVAWKVEAVSEDRVLLQEQDQHVDMTLNSFDSISGTMAELSRIRADYYGDLEYDSNTGIVYHGSSGSSSREIHIRRVIGDELISLGGTSVYGSAQGGGGSSVLSSDGSSFFYGRLQTEAADVSNNLRVYDNVIVAASKTVAFDTEGNYFDSQTGNVLGDLLFEVGTIHVSSNHQDVWVFDVGRDEVVHYWLEYDHAGVLSNDFTDPASILATEVQESPQNGQVILNSDGSFSYTPNLDFVGEDQFRYEVSDGSGATSTATVKLSVIETIQENSAPVGSDVMFHVDANQVLEIDQLRGQVVSGTRLIRQFDSPGNVQQMEYSPEHQILAVRNSGTLVKIVDATTQHVISERWAMGRFTDLDLTPDGNFLFVADYNGVSGYNEDERTHYVHRYDLVNHVWSYIESPNVAGRIEAVSQNRVLQQETNQHVDLMLNSYSADANTMEELSRIRADYYGDFEFDHRTGRIYHGSSGSSSSEIHVRRLHQDQLINVQDTGVYGSAQGFGGTSVLSSDGQSFYYGRLQVEALDVENSRNVMRQSIYAASDQLAFSDREIYDADTGVRISELGFESSVQFVSDDGQHWWAFDSERDRLFHYAIDGKRVGILAFASDSDGDSLSVEIQSGPANGSVESGDAAGELRYLPDDGFVGLDTFTYRVFDGQASSPTYTVTVSVDDPSPINDPAVVSDDVYRIELNETLQVGVASASPLTVAEQHSLSLSPNMGRVEVSERFGVYASMSAAQVEIRDLSTGSLVSSLDAFDAFTDMDLSPDLRYLFVADYAGEQTGYGTPISPHHVHRYDIVSGLWVSKVAPRIAWRLEAVSENRVLLQEHDQHVDMTLNAFGDYPGVPMTELSRIRADYYGDMEYDHRTGRVYHGSSGSSSREVHVRRVLGDELLMVGSTGVYGSANGGGGSSTLSSGGLHFYYGRLQIEAIDITNNLNTFPETIIAATDDFAVSAGHLYHAETASVVHTFQTPIEFAFANDTGTNLWVVVGDELIKYEIASSHSGVIENDFDAESDSMIASHVSVPGNGTLVFHPNGAFTYEPLEGFVGTDQFQYQVVSADSVSEFATVEIVVQGPWHNKINAHDVDANGMVSPVDALMILNELQLRLASGASNDLTYEYSGRGYFDTSNNGILSPLDALIVINHLEVQSSGLRSNAETERAQFFDHYSKDENDHALLESVVDGWLAIDWEF